MEEEWTSKNFFSRGPYKSTKEKKEGKKYFCEICNKGYSGKSGLWGHLKRRKDHNDPLHQMDETSMLKKVVGLADEMVKMLKEILDKRLQDSN